MSDVIKFGSGLLGNRLIIYNNRVEIVTGFWPFRRKRVIPFSNIASVETPQFLNMVVIRTNDGKNYKYSVGNAKKIQQAIVERM